ncbi:hypothetical protein J6590_050289 [Homalodisca vitripennis]|nr:hypothetical protein J6590_050289 [Homalodisca vitripennis]
MTTCTLIGYTVFYNCRCVTKQVCVAGGGVDRHTSADSVRPYPPFYRLEYDRRLARLEQLLRYNPSERLGSGLLGVEEIKSHPFFDGILWEQIYNDGLMPV